VQSIAPRSTPVVHVGRRIVLGMAGLGAAGLLLGKNLNPLTMLNGLASGLGGANALGFRIYTVNGIPAYDPVTWRMQVDGMVAQPMSLSFDDVQGLPQSQQVGIFHCVTGWSVPNLTWAGVKMTDFLAQVKPLPGASYMTLYSSDGLYTDSISLQQASQPDVMLAHSMNGAPLPLEQGQPLRLIIPEMYGYKNIKWVNRIQFTDHPISGYWEQNGYPVNAYIKK
jgi:DMSO/TMAO reductase YedYZ molybdopterin-dependent catalytic subunit